MESEVPRYLVGTPAQPQVGRILAVDRDRCNRPHWQPDHRTVPCGPRRLRQVTLPTWWGLGMDAKALGRPLHAGSGTCGHRLRHQWCCPNWAQSSATVRPRSLARTPRAPSEAGPPKQRLLYSAQPRNQRGHLGPFCPAPPHSAATHNTRHHEGCALCPPCSSARRIAICGNRKATTGSSRPQGKRRRMWLRVPHRRKSNVRPCRWRDDDVAAGALWLQPSRRLSAALHRRASGPATRQIPPTLAS